MVSMADTMRTCIGSEKFGIPRHDAPTSEFPIQPSQKDGIGRMCKPHWTLYTRALGADRKARATEAAAPAPTPKAAKSAAAKPPKAAKSPAAKAPRARKGGPIGYIGSAPGGPVEILPGGKKRRVAPAPTPAVEVAPALSGRCVCGDPDCEQAGTGNHYLMEDTTEDAALEARLSERRDRIKAVRVREFTDASVDAQVAAIAEKVGL